MGTENLHRLGRPIIANRRLAEKRPIVGRVLSKGAQPVRAMPNILTRTQIIAAAALHASVRGCFVPLRGISVGGISVGGKHLTSPCPQVTNVERESTKPADAARSAVMSFAHFCATGCLQKFPADKAVQQQSVKVLHRLIEAGQAEPVAEAGGVAVLIDVIKRLPIMHYNEVQLSELPGTSAAWKKECSDAKTVYEAIDRLTELHPGSQAVAKMAGVVRTLEEAKMQW